MKRLILSATLLFVSYSFAAAPTVGPIPAGERLWDVVSRIGEASNIIESKLCELQFSKFLEEIIPDCDSLIEVVDIPITITAPGLYCLMENITYGVKEPITISSSGVTLDLLGHTIDCIHQTNNGVSISSGVDDLIIKNGRIENALNGVQALDTAIPFTNNNLSLLDLDCVNCVTGISLLNSGMLGNRVFVQNCNVYGPMSTTGFAIDATDIVMNNCRAVQVNGNGVVITVSDRALIENCQVSNGLIAGSGGIGFLYAGKNIVFRNCLVHDVFEHGFATQGIGDPSNIVFEHCIAQRCGSAADTNRANGFDIDSVVFGPTMANFWFKDCVAQDCFGSGFALNGGASGTYDTMRFDRCLALDNSDFGYFFEVSMSLPGAVRNGYMLECIARNNAMGGFYFVDPAGIPMLTDWIVHKCIAQENGADGFHCDVLTARIKFLDCCALANTETGINNLAIDANVLLGNSAFDNGFDLTGVSDPTMVVARSDFGALSGSSSWANAVS